VCDRGNPTAEFSNWLTLELDNALEVAQQPSVADEIDSTATAYAHYFLAMTHFHLGNEASAHAELQKADQLADSEHSPSWNRELTLDLLAEEAHQLISP